MKMPDEHRPSLADEIACVALLIRAARVQGETLTLQWIIQATGWSTGKAAQRLRIAASLTDEVVELSEVSWEMITHLPLARLLDAAARANARERAAYLSVTITGRRPSWLDHVPIVSGERR